MACELISEVMDDSGLGIKVRLTETTPREELQALGELWAEAGLKRAERVWVWIYGGDMDEHGPAISVTYLETGNEPVSSYVPTSTLLLYYLGAGGFSDFDQADVHA